MFKAQLLIIKNQYSKYIKVFCANGGEELIFAKLKDLCNKKEITIKYAAPYMPKENNIA